MDRIVSDPYIPLMPDTSAPPQPLTPAEELSAHIGRYWASQAGFARAAGISQVALSHYFVGRRGLSPRVASRIRKTVLAKERKSALSLERLLGI